MKKMVKCDKCNDTGQIETSYTYPWGGTDYFYEFCSCKKGLQLEKELYDYSNGIEEEVEEESNDYE